MTKILIGALLFCIACPGFIHAQTERPECVYRSSDFDGDGFGYENNTTCIITENSRGEVPADTECEDDDGDGWGWNGVTSCRAPVSEPVCVDTPPENDGWGWDGVSSCRILQGEEPTVPESPAFSEVDEIASHFIDIDIPATSSYSRAAVAVCPSATYYFLYNGSLYRNTRSGLWSTGVSTSDERVRMALGNDRGGIFFIVLSISDSGVWEGSGRSDDYQCEWLQ